MVAVGIVLFNWDTLVWRGIAFTLSLSSSSFDEQLVDGADVGDGRVGGTTYFDIIIDCLIL